MSKVLAVIPARYQSRRFPGKVLHPILGKPMLRWVWEAARKARSVDELVIATDDERVLRAAEAWGARAVMTRGDHPSGSDRVAEVAKRVHCSFVINIQGDEPLLRPEVIDALVDALIKDQDADISTPITRISPQEAKNPNVVKTVVNREGRAMYFSRALIPYPFKGEGIYWKHIGIYAYRKYALLRFVKHEPSFLEATEGLEQLRALELGMQIRVVPVEGPLISVDVPEDIPKVEAVLRARRK